MAWTTPSNTLNPHHSRPSLSTHTLPESTSSAARPSHLLPSQEPSPLSPMLPQEAQLSSRLLLPRDQSPLPSRLTNPSSNSTPAESSTLLPAEPTSTTVSSPSDTDKDTSLSRTPGPLPGEIRDTSRSLTHPPTSAVSSLSHPTQLPERYSQKGILTVHESI